MMKNWLKRIFATKDRSSIKRGRCKPFVRLRLEELESRIVPSSATVQFTTGSETVNESAGTFSIPVTLSGTPAAIPSPFASGFNGAIGEAFDGAGNLYIANFSANTVSKVTPGGVVSTFASGFHGPFGLTFDGAGNLYVANEGAGTVSEVTPGGVVSAFASPFGEPTGLAFDSVGNLYVADASGFVNAVDKVTPGGAISTFATGLPDALALAFDSAGNLYVALGSAGAVDKVTPGGAVSTFASGFNQPDGLTFDSAGNLFVASGGDGTVSEVTPGGAVSLFASGFNDPHGLVFDSAGNLIVANFNGGEVNTVSTAVTVPFTLGGTAHSGTDFSGVTGSPLLFSPGQTRADVTGTLLSDPGSNQTIVITLGTPSSNAALGSPAVNTLTIDEPALAPTLTSINPTSVAAGDPDTTITLTGTNFVNSSTADFNGVALATTFVNSTQLTAVVPAAELVSPGSELVTVVSGGNATASQTFTVTSPTVQFNTGSENVNESAGTFSIPVTLSSPVPTTLSTFASGLSRPVGSAFDAAGNLYVAEEGTNTVDEITPGGTVSVFASGFDSPVELAFDAAGNLYVSNIFGGTVSKVTPAGVVSAFASGFSFPEGLAFDAAGNLFVANNGDAVSKVTPGGVVSAFAAGFSNPDGLAFDAAGNLYVSNANNTVSKVTPGGTISTFASGFNLPEDLTFDAAGNLFVANTNDNTVDKVTPAGVVSAFASGFNSPNGLAFDAAGNLFVVNDGSATVSEVSSTVTVPFTLGGSAVSGTDFSGVTASPLTFTLGQSTADITGTLLSDPGPNQTLTFTLGTPANATLGSPAVNTLTIDEPNPVPTLTSINPTSATAGGPDTTVTLTGTGFVNGSTAEFNNLLTLATTFVSSAELTAVIPAIDLTSAGSDAITVVTAGPGGGRSAAQTFTVNSPTAQFNTGSETVNETAGTFSIPITLSAPAATAVSTFASGFTSPGGLAFDAADNLYVSNFNANTVSKVTPGGVVTTFATGFSEPEDLAFDAAGNLFVANESGTVSEVTPGGVVSTFASGFSEPFGLAFDAAGNLYVSNFSGSANTVSKVTPGGVVGAFATGFNKPAGLAFDAAGNLFVANFSGGTVSEVTPGGVVSTFASGFASPDGLAFDAAGNLYVANSSGFANTVSKVTPGGVVSTFASGMFDDPSGLAFDAAGNLFVANGSGDTVSEVSTSVTVPFTLGGTAVSGTDFSGVTASPLTFDIGQTSENITGTLLSDPNANPTIVFTLGTPTNATLGAPTTNTLTITETPPIQTASITSIVTITGISAGTNTAFENTPFTAVINGSNFATGATVTFGAVSLTPDSVTPTQVTFTVPAAVSLAADEGVVNVAVVNPGQAPSNAAPITILEELLPDGTRGTPNQRFLSEVYRDLLGRAIDQSGLNSWGALLNAGVSRINVVLGIENDPGHEFLHVEVNDAFMQYLHHGADAGGLASFTNFLANGGTAEQMDAFIVSSPEYQTFDAGGTYQGFLTAFYQDALGRAPISTDPAVSSPLTPYQVATDVFASPEFQLDLAKGFYQRFLDRAFGPGDAARAGTPDGLEIAEIVGDPAGEYYNKTAP